MDESVQEFWDNMAAEVGEKILIRCLGQCISGHPDVTRERWGVFFLTGSAIYFKTFKETPHFLESLIRRKKSDEREIKELFFGIPFDSIIKAKLPASKNFWQKFVSRPDEKSSFIYNDGTGREVEFSYTVATNQDEFFKIFGSLMP